MLQHAGRLSTATIQEITRDVHAFLRKLFKNAGPGKRLGLAISGGVDSMALASLCSQYRSSINLSERQQAQFSGYIVDHGFRAGSNDEAHRVAEKLNRIGIEPKVLKLDWSAHGDPMATYHFENLARKLRYQAIGQACLQDDVRSVLVAHHADDQMETVMTRIALKWLGWGLRGIQAEGNYPECEGLYGIDGSGRPKLSVNNVAAIRQSYHLQPVGMAVEGGGLQVHRPLLKFTKSQLIALCEENGVEWFEDVSNADRTLTTRNAIRYMHRRHFLPQALQPERLCQVAASVSERRAELDRQADERFRALPITLDLATGTATIEMPSSQLFKDLTMNTDYTLAALILRKLLLLVSPLRHIPLQDLPSLVGLFLDEKRNRTAFLEQIGGVSVRGTNDRTIILHRMRPVTTQINTQTLIWPESAAKLERRSQIRWSQWLLWDERYWIRVGHHGQNPPATDVKLGVTFMTVELLANLQKTLSKLERAYFSRRVDAVSIQTKLTIPAIVVTRSGDSFEGTGAVKEEVQVLALPSIGWNNPRMKSELNTGVDNPRNKKRLAMLGKWVWEIRYKDVQFGDREEHKFAYSAIRRKPNTAALSPFWPGSP